MRKAMKEHGNDGTVGPRRFPSLPLANVPPLRMSPISQSTDQNLPIQNLLFYFPIAIVPQRLGNRQGEIYTGRL